MAPNAFLAVGTIVLLVGAWVWRKLYPKPLPGFPHNASSTNRIFGDLVYLQEHLKKTKEPTEGVFEIGRKSGAALSQFLLSQFGGAWVLLDDPREIEDIFLRRNREFDRSTLTTEIFKPLVPHSTLANLTTPEVRAQKRLWADAMNADFLRRVVAPNIQIAALDLVELWKVKAAAAAGTPFQLDNDFQDTALDAIWVAILGAKLGVVQHKTEKAGGLTGKSTITAAQLRSAEIMLRTMKYAEHVIDIGIGSAWPAWNLFWLKLTPGYRRFSREASGEVRQLMLSACERLQKIESDSTDGEELDTCAMDLVLRREIVNARKAGKPDPDPTKEPAMLDELLLMLLAGHDSTANTLGWFVKLMARFPEQQAKLRETLQKAWPQATTTPPTAAEIMNVDIPYLDAAIEETVRASATAAISTRTALVDTTILGKHIPAGTQVLMNLRINRRPIPVRESDRSPTSQAAEAKRPRGGLDGESGENLDVFEPRRWLATDPETGKEVFDSFALPQLTFGGGLRGCFGKRLAMMELRIILVILMLNFEFLPLSEELNDMEGTESIFRQPKTLYVNLKTL